MKPTISILMFGLLATGCIVEADDGTDADPVQPAVAITSSTCVIDPDVRVESTFDVTLDIGQGFEASGGSFADPGTQFLVFRYFDCGAWTRTSLAPDQPGQDYGCERAEGQPERQVIELLEIEELEAGELPAELAVGVVATIRDEPVDGEEVLSTDRTVDCAR